MYNEKLLLEFFFSFVYFGFHTSFNNVAKDEYVCQSSNGRAMIEMMN